MFEKLPRDLETSKNNLRLAHNNSCLIPFALSFMLFVWNVNLMMSIVENNCHATFLHFNNWILWQQICEIMNTYNLLVFLMYNNNYFTFFFQNLSVELQLENHAEFSHDFFKGQVDRASGARYGTGERALW